MAHRAALAASPAGYVRAMIAILGTGLLGAGFARALVKKRETVHVWNRTAARAKALEAHGAKAFDNAAEAVRDAKRVHIVVSDDDAVDSVLAAAAPGLSAGALVIDHSTTSPAGALRRTQDARARGFTYLHAPVFMGPQNALESSGVMMVSGDRDVVAKVRKLLEPMTGKLVDLGPRVDAAAAFKLLGNSFLMALAAGFLDLLALGKAMQVAPAEVAKLFDFFNPGGSLAARFGRMISGSFDEPSWELAMARKDARLMQAEADRAGLPLTSVTPIAELMDAMIAAGHAHADWTVVAKDLLKG